jgi:hypothetical protein
MVSVLIRQASYVFHPVYRRTQGFANSSPDVECWRVIIAHLWVCITLLHLGSPFTRSYIHSSIIQTLRLSLHRGYATRVSSRINITVKATGRIHFHVPICRLEKRKVQVSAVALHSTEFALHQQAGDARGEN